MSAPPSATRPTPADRDPRPGLPASATRPLADLRSVGDPLHTFDAYGRSTPKKERRTRRDYHTGNEEALFVLSGEGRLRLDGEELPLSAGVYAALPADEHGAHRVVNDSEGPLRYLMASTMTEPDVAVYPDTDKLGVFVGAPPGGEGERSVHGYYRRDDDVGYRE